VTVASIDRMKYPLPGKPLLPVLPFVNISKDRSRNFFATGERGIITALFQGAGVFVISRSSAFRQGEAGKGQAGE